MHTCLLALYLICHQAPAAAALSAVQAGAVAFDTWQTSQWAYSGGHESDVLARPIVSAGRPTLATAGYAEVTAGAWLANRMRRSENRAARRLWWLPQVAAIVGHSIAIGVSES